MLKRLLVIEDNKAIATVIAHMGSSIGYEVTVAGSLAEVKQILAKKRDFFIATIDYSLPDAFDGQAIPYVLEHGIPSIIMTGRMDTEIHKKLLNFGIVDFITKENSQAYHYLMRVLHGQKNNHKIGVLVVDSSLTSRNLTCNLLKRRNFTVYDVPDGNKALQALEQNPEIKLVITDQRLPFMSGISLVQNIRKDFSDRNLILIGLSRSTRSYHAARFIKSGADDFLYKPFCPEEFYCRIMQNIEKLQFIEEVKEAANTDYLTSLANRRFFLEQANKIFEEIKETECFYILIIFQIDDFKNINDTYGHNAGDHVLIEISTLINKHFPQQLVARFSGAEFGCLLSGDNIQALEQRIEKFMGNSKCLSTTFHEQQLNFSISLGGVIIDNQSSVKELLKQADEALQQAKKQGSNQMVLNNIVDISE